MTGVLRIAESPKDKKGRREKIGFLNPRRVLTILELEILGDGEGVLLPIKNRDSLEFCPNGI